jgi:hypothetical protein
MAYEGTDLAALNYFLRNTMLEPGLIQPDTIINSPLLRALESRLIRAQFRGKNAELEVLTAMALTGGPSTDESTIRYAGEDTYSTGYAPMRRLEVNVGSTMGAIHASANAGTDGSWGKVILEKLKHRKIDWDLTLDQVLMGNGSGVRGVVLSSSYNGGTLTITLDNTYRETGWENTAMLRKGQRVEIYHAGIVTDGAGATNFPITAVTFGNRDNGAATTGTIAITVGSDISASCVDNDLIYIRGGISLGVTLPEPMGIIAHLQGNGDSYAGTSALATYQAFTRANLSSMKALVWDAADFASGGVGGTPDDWELRNLAQFVNEIRRGSGQDGPDLMLVSSQMAQTLADKNRQNQGVNIAVRTMQNAGEQQKMVIGVEYASTFRTGGQDIEIAVADTVPDNVIHFIRKEDFRWMQRSPGFYNYASDLNMGDVWMPSKGDRYNAIEAPFGGEMQIMAHRCDRSGTIQDLIAD